MRTMPILLLVALVLAPAAARAGLPDLCDDVHLDPTGRPYTDSTGMPLSRFCTWTNELDVTLWAKHVCCSIGTTSASCTATSPSGRCLAGAKMWCDYATVSGSTVTCQQPWPDACEAGLCSVAPSTPVATIEPLCCLGTDNCWPVAWPGDCIAGQFVQCDSPYTNSNGTVGCADDE